MPFEKMDEISYFYKQKTFPKIEDFYDSLHDKRPTQDEYLHGQTFFNTFRNEFCANIFWKKQVENLKSCGD